MKRVSSKDVWQWPEFQAFARRLGIPRQFVTDIDIHIRVDDAVRFTMAAFAAENEAGGTEKTES